MRCNNNNNNEDDDNNNFFIYNIPFKYLCHEYASLKILPEKSMGKKIIFKKKIKFMRYFAVVQTALLKPLVKKNQVVKKKKEKKTWLSEKSIGTKDNTLQRSISINETSCSNNFVRLLLKWI